jgi:hypothetical protein
MDRLPLIFGRILLVLLVGESGTNLERHEFAESA